MPEQIVFRPFAPRKPVRVYYRNLPHWRQTGATYFVTFRQADSIPVAVLGEWHDIRKRWFAAHNLDLQQLASHPEQWNAKYSHIPEQVRRAFEKQQARMLHEELDRCHGSCLLRLAKTRAILAESLHFFHGKRVALGDFVIMPNHVHVLLIPFDGWELENLLESIKKWSSRLIGQHFNRPPNAASNTGSRSRRPRFWQQETYDRIIRDAEELSAFRRYIASNPEAAKVRKDEHTYHAAPWLDAFAQL